MANKFRLHADFFEATHVKRDKTFKMLASHSHTSHEIIIIESGKANMVIKDRLFSVTKGDVLLIPKETLHKNNGGYDHTRYVINVSDDYLKKYLTEDAHTQLTDCFKNNNISLTDSAFYRAIDLARQINGGDYDYVYLINLLALLCSKESHKRSEQSHTNEHINSILEYINNNYAKITSLDDIADAMHISKSYLCQLVKRTTDMTVSEYLNGIRINHACSLLQQKELNISETAYACGFDSVSYFGKVFRKSVNMSPMEFKKITHTSEPAEISFEI